MLENIDKIIYNIWNVIKIVIYNILRVISNSWKAIPLPIKIIILIILLMLVALIAIKTYKSIKNKDYLKRNDYEGPLDDLLNNR